MSNVKLTIDYYSATGTNHTLAKWAEESAKAEGAEVRLAKAGELAPDAAIASNPAWQAHHNETKDVVKEATSEDLEWADAIIFSTATRFGGMASQMKQFLDMQGGLWAGFDAIDRKSTRLNSS